MAEFKCLKFNMFNIVYSLRSKEEFMTMCGVLVKSNELFLELKKLLAPLKKVSRDQKDKEIFVDVLRTNFDEEEQETSFVQRNRVKIFDDPK